MNDGALLIVFTGAEIVLLVAVLAAALVLIGRELRRIGEAMAETRETVDELERELGEVWPAATELNFALEQIADALPGIAERAERLTPGR